LTPPVEGGDSSSIADGATGAIDYIKFRRHRLNYKDSDRAYYGRSFPESSSTKFDYNKDIVYLAMPKSLQTSYAPQYTQIDLGVLGVSTIAALGGDLSNTDNLTAVIQSAARAALPEFAGSAVSSIANGLSAAGGLAGNLNANSLQALTRGRVFNPFKEQVFQGMQFRQHNFNFKLVSRNAAEAAEVRNILRYFKEGSVPFVTGAAIKGDNVDTAFSGDQGSAIKGGLDAASSQRFFQIPDSFNIDFVRMSADGRSMDGSGNPLHFKIHPSVCTTINVNYTPDGQYTAFKSPPDIAGGVSVPAIDLTLQFTELKLVTGTDIREEF
jgi:hypothetical protein